MDKPHMPRSLDRDEVKMMDRALMKSTKYEYDIDECSHVLVQGTWKWDTHTEVGNVVCINCGKEKS